MKKTLLLLLSCALCASLFAQKETSNIRHGNRAYEDDEFSEAEEKYRKAVEKDDASFEAHYNLGNALYRKAEYAKALDEYENARNLLQKSVSNVRDVPKDDYERLSQTYHNMGNACLMQINDTSLSHEERNARIHSAIEAYKNSLRLNPGDDETRYNLVRAQMMLPKQQSGGGGGSQSQSQSQPQPQQNQEQQQELSDETVEQILQALDQDEREAKENQPPVQGQKRRVENDW